MDRKDVRIGNVIDSGKLSGIIKVSKLNTIVDIIELSDAVPLDLKLLRAIRANNWVFTTHPNGNFSLDILPIEIRGRVNDKGQILSFRCRVGSLDIENDLCMYVHKLQNLYHALTGEEINFANEMG